MKILLTLNTGEKLFYQPGEFEENISDVLKNIKGLAEYHDFISGTTILGKEIYILAENIIRIEQIERETE